MSLEGRTLFGHLVVEDLLGRGGMGEVYRAFDRRLERPVALKTLPGRRAGRPRGRILREARILSRLNHPNICQVYDLLEGEEHDCLVLELVDGQTLRRVLRREDPSPETRLQIALAVTEALAAAHREGILHRDLKPDNVMITAEGKVKVLDFGIARTEADGDEDLQGSGSGEEEEEDPDRTLVDGLGAGSVSTAPTGPPLGTLTYMSPEQARREPLTLASDAYSLGLVLQELFTGHRALPKRLPREELLRRACAGETEPAVGIGGGLRSLIEDLKAADPQRRPTAEEALRRLREVAAEPARRRHRRRWILASALAAVLVLASAGAALFVHQQARREARMAQRFTQEAAELEAKLRIEYLAPAHDIRPVQEELRQGMVRLQERMKSLSSAAVGPGSSALGRIALALEDFEAARGHFQRAWNSGYREPEVVSGLALASFELFRLQAPRVLALEDEERREAEWDRIWGELGAEAFDMLTLSTRAEAQEAAGDAGGDEDGAVTEADSADYLEALRAFHRRDDEAALTHARAAGREDPLFYEAALLEGKIQRARMEEAYLRGDLAGTAEFYEQASRALDRAAEVGRSDPAVHQEIAEVRLSRALAELYYGSGEQFDRFHEASLEACDTVERIDPGHRGVRVIRAELLLRSAEAGGFAEESRALLREASEILEPALEDEEGRPAADGRAWKVAGHIAMVEADWQVHRLGILGADLDAILARARSAYERAVALEPRVPRFFNSLGNAYALIAEVQRLRGQDPRPLLDQAVEAYRRCLTLDPDDIAVYGNLVLALATAAEHAALAGSDVEPTVKEGEEVLQRARAHTEGSSFLEQARATLLQAAARADELRGRDPRPRLQEVREAARRGLELGFSNYLERELATSLIREGEYLLRAGDDPSEPLRQIRDFLEEAEAGEADPGFHRLMTATLKRLEAVRLLSRGERDAARRALAEGRTALADLGEMEGAATALLEEARSFLLEARLLREAAAGPALASAGERLQKAAALEPKEVEITLARAELELLAAELLGSERGRARQILEGILEVHPEWPAARALMEQAG